MWNDSLRLSLQCTGLDSEQTALSAFSPGMIYIASAASGELVGRGSRRKRAHGA